MGPELQAHVAFHLTGKRMGAGLQAAEGLQLRPGLLARFNNLAQLRHDFPLVLVAGQADESGIQSLSGIVNDILQAIAPRGIEGEATRRHLLRLEHELRTLVANGETGLLSRLWDLAAKRIGALDDSALADSLGAARAALPVDGEVVDCTHGLPWQLVTHAWKTLQQRKAAHRALELKRLSIRLSDILQADFVRSRAGTSAARLRASVGTGMEDAFDFQAMSGTLAQVAGKDPLPDSRRRRVQSALSVLVANQLTTQSDIGEPDDFGACAFANCRDALAAFHDRLPKIIELVKAMAIAELEIEGRYLEATHDPFFADFDESSVGAGDLRLFPDYLVGIGSADRHSPENAGLMEILASEMPIKVVVQVSDVLEEPALRAHLGPVATTAQFGRMAMGLGSAWVLQSCSSRLYRARGKILAGLAHAGPALFSVFSGSAHGTEKLPPYLLTAAALESRAFPEFTYDPAAGPDWSTRFSLDGNPQPGADWPVHEFGYEDEAHQRVTEQVAFTFVDFIACDPRHAGHFALVPRGEWNENLIPVGSYLAHEPPAGAGKIPYIPVVDEDHVLRRALADERLLSAARRCLETWHGLQQLGGAGGSRTPSAPAAAPAVLAGPASAPDAAAARPVAEEAAPERPSDEAYIDTPRCTTCNECTNLNNRLFAYDANKQAYIADINAGTYRELVEAAESCQVAIIHPGKPRNPDEPGIAELLKRAEPFL
jgi:ferredoxin